MKHQHLPLYAIALAILIVGLTFAGVPAQTLLLSLLVLACPLMMIFMMDGHGMNGHGDDGSQGGAGSGGGRTHRSAGDPR